MMGGACGKCGGERRCIQGFGEENQRGRNHLKDIDLDGRIILKGAFNK
jgi:hypothetical protein